MHPGPYRDECYNMYQLFSLRPDIIADFKSFLSASYLNGSTFEKSWQRKWYVCTSLIGLGPHKTSKMLMDELDVTRARIYQILYRIIHQFKLFMTKTYGPEYHSLLKDMSQPIIEEGK